MLMMMMMMDRGIKTMDCWLLVAVEKNGSPRRVKNRKTKIGERERERASLGGSC